ncbi:hypothetical protein CFC21_064209 [Triticum aestivum]|uniref:Uncharacterized protein n=2 Tax=Triticum aestivum TaxID=4565 RepID=A0A9R1H0Y0_WHEAT|nr:hypothetical protein CFC21_064209 [Triticum aestivum]
MEESGSVKVEIVEERRRHRPAASDGKAEGMRLDCVVVTLYNSVGRATATFLTTLAACWFFHHPIHNKSNESASDFF